MKTDQKLWTRDELILTMNLYCKLPFGKLHNKNPKVIKLAELIGRTLSSVSYKLVNLASLDPSLQARGIKGAVNASNLDREIWNEFYQHWNVLPFESEKLLAKFENIPVEKLNEIPEDELPKEGKTRDQVIKLRVNQSFFRKLILASYNNTCCITGIEEPELLVSGHIRPWSLDESNRLNPRNGILLNALHDKAFENGLITITKDYKVKVSSILKKQKREAYVDYFLKYDDKPIILPTKFLPDIKFLEYHHLEKFRK
jgi:putative restriction endonuclease